MTQEGKEGGREGRREEEVVQEEIQRRAISRESIEAADTTVR